MVANKILSRNITPPPSLDHWLRHATAQNPDAIALESPDTRLTYASLSAQVQQQAELIRSAGLIPGDRIAIAATRSADTIIAILAAIESGVAYVPLDLSYPADRLQAMLGDAQARAVLGEAAALSTLRELVGQIPSLAQVAPPRPRPFAAAPDLAYVLFTSGSTGRPKGVAMGALPLRHLIQWHAQHARLGQAARTLQFAPLSFDVHFQEIFSSLACAGTLVLIPDSHRRDPALLHQAMQSQRVERIFLPYVALQMLAQADQEAHAEGLSPLGLKEVVSAGEQLQVTPTIRALFERLPGAVLHNHYGPTESHVVTAHELQGSPASWPGIPPIGQALPHVRIALRDPDTDRISQGDTGELLLGGETLAHGYLGQADLSAERFLDGPAGLEGRWYATGDLVSQDAQGVLSYQGRIDQQLKVDGFRIEPGDIELALMAHEAVQDAAVTAPDVPGAGRQLVAHVVLRPDSPALNALLGTLRSWLRERLPDYMIPVRFIALDKLPTTPSGKIDRRNLPLPALAETSPDASQAGRPAIERLRALWQELLGLPDLADDTNVFEAGARSLLVMRFVGRAKQLGLNLSVADIYDRPTIAGMAQSLRGSTTAPHRRATQTGLGEQDGIAIIGMSIRADNAHDLDTFWTNLLNDRESVRRFAPHELDPSVPEDLRNRPNFVAARGVLEDADRFDAAFFGISPREATVIDPQQRLFLELCWSALENAAIDPSRVQDRIGVYAGSANNTYLPAMRAEAPDLIQRYGEFATMLANEKDYIATRAANRLNLRGPAVSIHTACSTSLVAITQAWHALAQGQCDVALAGGVTVVVPQPGGYLYVEGSMESADGRCRPFDADASGTVFASGGGVVVLKRLKQAQADGDTVYAVIKGVGINNDGGDKASFTAPSVSGQAEAITTALDHAGVNARSIGYVEAHGTGTALGDPIEIAALSRAWSRDTPDRQFCQIGSIKGHVGHTVAAAGVIGLIKTTLALHRERLPGTLHYRQPNPQINFADTPFEVLGSARDWPRGTQPRRAAVSSFGVGGTNAHVVLEEAPERPASSPADQLSLLPLSAKSTEAALQRAQDLASHLERHPEVALSSVVATLTRGRQAMGHRVAVVAHNVAGAIEVLRQAKVATVATAKPRLVFLFPGQGSQHPGMARHLYDEAPAFREAFDQCLAVAPADLAAKLHQWLVKALPTDAEAAAQLAETRHAQAALFSVSHALTAWLDSLGIRPDAMIGHSIGEYAAACHAGVLSVAEAMTAVIARGQAMFDQAAGAMLAVRASADLVRSLMPHGVEIAAANAPALTVVAGGFDVIAAFATALEAQDIGTTRLKVSHAFHSASMDGALPSVAQALAHADLKAPSIPMYSCISGARLQAHEAVDPHYWARQVRAAVQFSRAVQTELDQGDALFVEVGPGQALTALMRQHRTAQNTVPRVVPLLGPSNDPGEPAIKAWQGLGALWCAGVDLSWPVPAHAHRVALPAYPFRGEPHWFARGNFAATGNAAPPVPVSPIQEDARPMSRLPRLEQELTRILSDVSGIPAETVSRDATFLDLGLDSLSLTQATLELERVFGIKLRFRRLMEDLDTLAKLGLFLDAELPAEKFAAPAASAPVPQAMLPTVFAPQQAVATGGAVHQLIQQQMQLMAQQLALLSGQSAASVPLTAVAAPTTAPSSAPAIAQAASPAEPAQPSKNALRDKPFGASARIVLEAQTDFTPAQRQWLDDFIQRYNQRSGQSKSFSQQNRKVMADPRVVTGFNPLWKDLVYPIVVNRSHGASLWDIDGNEYIDLLSCFGGNLLGHQPESVIAAMSEQLQLGLEVGPQHPMAAEVADLISEFTGMERVGFCNTGSEAVMGAMRIARTVTGRKTIAIFTNSYHGIFDEVIVRGTKQLRSLSAAPGILANAVENILVLDWNSEDSLRVLRERGTELAAIMTEPIQNKYPTLQPREFVQSLREIADRAGCALIFDEVVTGFRVAPGGSQEFYGVRADIATYGKVIGGGLPFAAIAGNSNWLDALDGGHWQYGDDSYPEAGVTYFAGTFVRHPLALAAARATLLHLKRGGREFYRQLNGRTQGLIDRLNEAFAQRGAPVKAVHCASLWRLQWDDHQKHISLFYYLARFHGLHLYEQFGHFVTEAMTDAHTDRIVEVFTNALDELIALGLIVPNGSGAGHAALASALPQASQGGPTESTLTPGQTERWLAAIYDPAARRALNESFCVTLTGQVDRIALKQALQDVLNRHDAFKLRFDLDQPRQIIDPAAQVPIAEVDLSGQADSEQALDQHGWQASATDFPLDQAPLARASILTLADGRVVVHVVASHLIFDGWASSVFNAELAQAYRARSLGQQAHWATPGSPLAFATAEQARLDSEDGQASTAHWQQVLNKLPPLVSLGDRAPTGPRTFAADTARARIDGVRLNELRAQAKAHGATLFQWLLHTVAELIAQETGQRDMVVSIPYAAQNLERHAPLLADGVLDLPVRLQVTEGESPKAGMARVKNALMDAMEHPLMTQGIAARALGLQAEGSRPPLTAIYFNLNPKVDLSGWAPLKAQMHEGRKRGLLSELFFNFYEQTDALTLDLHHSSEYLSLARAQQLAGRLMALLSPGAATASAGLDERLLNWNQTDRALDPQARIEAWVARQSSLTPEATALVTEEGTLSYAELEARSNQIARVLQSRGAGAGQRVGISLPRGRHLLPALLGVLKTGAAYVPMDPGFPTERLKMMAEDAGLTLVVTHSSCAEASGLPHAQQLRLDSDAGLIEAASTAPLPALTDTQAPAYVIYTSGSTGRPKGVAVPQGAVCNFLSSMQREPGFAASDRLLAVTTLSFDIAVLELLLPLVTGGTVVLATRDQAMDGEALMALAARQQVTVMQATPTTWHLLLDAGWQAPRGFRALVGGEPLPAALAATLLGRGLDVWNMYGPTETTVWSTLSHVQDPGAKITIGRPIDNTQVWILDEALRPVPIGAEGEICIGGDGVALGYHGRPDLTSDRFVSIAWGPRAGQRIYRTGDLGRWREDGQLEHLGRMDFQVKIRGYRIELGEIEAQLEAQAGVARAVVVALEMTPGDMALIGYVVPQAGGALDTAALRAALRQTLPDYMVPRTILVLPKLPLLPNNKIDRKALPLPATAQTAAAPSAKPAIEATASLAAATDTVALEMGKLLGRSRLGDHDHFFEQGAHSLIAAKLSSTLATALGHRPGLRMIFDHPTPVRLAQALKALKREQDTSTTIAIRADQSTAPLSQMQERVWFLENLQQGTSLYNVPSGHRLLGPLDVEAFNHAWRLLIQRQSVLRTVIERTAEGDVQRILPDLPFQSVPFDDFSHLPETDRQAAMDQVIAELIDTPYDLEKGPLFTVRLFRLTPEEHGLLFQAHHLIWDAWSFDLLYVDLPELYSACLNGREPALPPVTVSYGDFAAWHNEWMSGPELQRQLAYWREQLTPMPPAIELPLDLPRPPRMSGLGGSFQFNLSKDLAEALRAQAQQQGRTLYITLLAAFALALHHTSDQADFVIGTPVRGREQPVLEPMMGFFVNMLPLRMQFLPAMSMQDWLTAVHRKVVDAFSFPDVPFDHLVQVLQVPRDRSRPPLHQVSFSYQDVRERSTRWGNVDHQRMKTPRPGASQDLALWCVETLDNIEFVFTFNADVLETPSVEAFATGLESVLRKIVEDPGRPLDAYQLRADKPTPSAPETSSLESVIADVWRGMLGLAQFAPDDDFFASGGHSLLVMRSVTQIRTRTGRQVSVHTIFDNPTPRQLAAALEQDESTTPATLTAINTASQVHALTVPHRQQQDTAPLSRMQQRVWYLENLSPGTISHHIPSAHRLSGPLDTQALNEAWLQLVARQPALRTVIGRTPAGDHQSVLSQLDAGLLPLIDLSDLPAQKREPAMQALIDEQSRKPFNLELGPLFTVRLFKLNPQEHVLFLLVHHLIWDGWSFGIFNDELSALYAAKVNGQDAELPALPVTYGDFAAWHHQWMSGDELARQTRFWQHQMTPPPAPLTLPIDRARPPVPSGEGGSVMARLDPETTLALRAAAQGRGRTLFTTLLAAFGLLIGKLTGQDDIVIGTPVRGRDHPELESLIGFFVNSLPLRLRPQGQLTLDDWLAQVQRQMIDAFSHPDVPLDHLVRSLQLQRALDGAPLYQVMFSYQDAREHRQSWGNVTHARHDVPMAGTAQDLALWCVDTPQGIECAFSYNADILEEASVQAIADKFTTLLKRFSGASTAARLQSISLLSDQEQHALAQWNDTTVAWPQASSLLDLLRHRPHASSSDIAISQTGERALSHAELWAQVDQVSHYLRTRGIGRGALVGVCMPRSPDLLTAVLGVLQAGAAYVPLDPQYPAERLAYMAEDAGLAWVIGRSEVMQALSWPRDKTLLMDLDERHLQGLARTPLAPDATLDAQALDAAYVIYTSGSTGKPKGVVVPHGSVVNFLRSMEKEPGLRAGQRLLAVTTLSFDISVLELFLPLLVGAEVVLCPAEAARDPLQLKAQVEDDIHVMQATPSTWHALIEADWRGHGGFTALVGGEALSVSLAEQLLARCGSVWNMYGPTETTVWSTCWQVAHPEQGIRIGRPIANTQVHVLDAHGQTCAIGIPGELWIGGAGVTTGYLNRAELTAERFVATAVDAGDKARLYRTGDLGRWHATGELEHLGRLDHQVKVRGHRIELGEIESALLADQAMAQALVLAREDHPGDVRLVAYCVARDQQGPELNTSALKPQLASTLPDYMVPQHIVMLKALPRLPNGKVDRSALPSPTTSRPEQAKPAGNTRAPGTPLEKAIAAIWSELIGVSDVWLDDNFFNLGGHSLLAMRAVTEIKHRTGVTVSVRRLIFETLGQLAATETASANAGVSKAAPNTINAEPVAKSGWLNRLFGR